MPQITSRTTAIDAIVYSVPLLTIIYDISYISPVFVSFVEPRLRSQAA